MHRRLDGLRAAIERGWEPSEEEAQAILKARARALAAPVQGDGIIAPLEVIEFVLAGESYAFESARVAEVFPLVHLTRLPDTPEFVLGIVHVRGEIVSVIDLRKFFGQAEQGFGDLNKVILLDDGEMVFGVLADRVDGVRIIDAGRLQPALATLTDRRLDYLKGIAEGRVVVLDADALLGDPRMIVHETMED